MELLNGLLKSSTSLTYTVEGMYIWIADESFSRVRIWCWLADEEQHTFTMRTSDPGSRAVSVKSGRSVCVNTKGLI